MLAFVQNQPTPLRLRQGYGWYFLGYLPLLGMLGLIEGSLRGLWGWSIAEWEYQLDGYIVMAGALVVSGIVAVPLHLLLVRALATHDTALPFGLLTSASALLVLALVAFGWLYLFSMPVSFGLAALAFGYLSAKHLKAVPELPA